MKPKYLVAALSLMIIISPTSLTAETKNLRFQDIGLRMSASEFFTRHHFFGNPLTTPPSGQAICYRGITGKQMRALSEFNAGTAMCSYDVPIHGQVFKLRVMALFQEKKIAVIELRPPTGIGSCLVKPPSDGTPEADRFAAVCTQYADFFTDIRTGLNNSLETTAEGANPYNLPRRRWENDSSVVQIEPIMCGPWNNTDAGWGLAISEVLEGNFCNVSNDQVNSQLSVILYVDKALAKSLASQLQNNAGVR